MKTFYKSILLLSIPFFIMILINESQRESFDLHYFTIYDSPTMNSAEYDHDSCTWACHNNTTHCIKYHATTIASYSDWIDPLYFGIINGLKKTGDYGVANVLLLVVVWPLSMCYLFIRILQMKKQLRNG